MKNNQFVNWYWFDKLTTFISVTSHGLSCEVCKCKAHKRCAAKAIANWWVYMKTIYEWHHKKKYIIKCYVFL